MLPFSSPAYEWHLLFCGTTFLPCCHFPPNCSPALRFWVLSPQQPLCLDFWADTAGRGAVWGTSAVEKEGSLENIKQWSHWGQLSQGTVVSTLETAALESRMAAGNTEVNFLLIWITVVYSTHWPFIARLLFNKCQLLWCLYSVLPVTISGWPSIQSLQCLVLSSNCPIPEPQGNLRSFSIRLSDFPVLIGRNTVNGTRYTLLFLLYFIGIAKREVK